MVRRDNRSSRRGLTPHIQCLLLALNRVCRATSLLVSSRLVPDDRTGQDRTGEDTSHDCPLRFNGEHPYDMLDTE